MLALVGCDGKRSEVSIATPDWDSLTYPLKMEAYYVTVSSRQQAAQLSLRIDVYIEGEAVQRSGGIIIHHLELKPIEMNNAIYFDKIGKNNDALWGTIVSAHGKNKGNRGVAPFKLDLPVKEDASLNEYRFSEPIKPNGITPLLAVVYGASSFIGSQNDLQTVLKYHKDVPVIVFSLEASQQIREFKPAPEQPLPVLEDAHPDATVLLQSK